MIMVNVLVVWLLICVLVVVFLFFRTCQHRSAEFFAQQNNSFVSIERADRFLWIDSYLEK